MVYCSEGKKNTISELLELCFCIFISIDRLDNFVPHRKKFERPCSDVCYTLSNLRVYHWKFCSLCPNNPDTFENIKKKKLKLFVKCLLASLCFLQYHFQTHHWYWKQLTLCLLSAENALKKGTFLLAQPVSAHTWRAYWEV